MKNYKKVIKIVANVIVWLFVAFAVGITILVFAAQSNADGVPAIGGKCSINVLTPSMSPTFKPGDLLICEMLTDEEKKSLEVGDIITFYFDKENDGKEELNSHRIVEVVKSDGAVTGYYTQGDNRETNPSRDNDPVPVSKVICKYTGKKFNGLGNFLSFLQTSTGFLVVIVLPLIAFFIYELIKFILTVMAVKGKKAPALSEAEEEEIKKKAIEEYLRQQAQAQNEKSDDDSANERNDTSDKQ